MWKFLVIFFVTHNILNATAGRSYRYNDFDEISSEEDEDNKHTRNNMEKKKRNDFESNNAVFSCDSKSGLCQYGDDDNISSENDNIKYSESKRYKEKDDNDSEEDDDDDKDNGDEKDDDDDKNDDDDKDDDKDEDNDQNDDKACNKSKSKESRNSDENYYDDIDDFYKRQINYRSKNKPTNSEFIQEIKCESNPITPVCESTKTEKNCANDTPDFGCVNDGSTSQNGCAKNQITTADCTNVKLEEPESGLLEEVIISNSDFTGKEVSPETLYPDNVLIPEYYFINKDQLQESGYYVNNEPKTIILSTSETESFEPSAESELIKHNNVINSQIRCISNDETEDRAPDKMIIPKCIDKDATPETVNPDNDIIPKCGCINQKEILESAENEPKITIITSQFDSVEPSTENERIEPDKFIIIQSAITGNNALPESEAADKVIIPKCGYTGTKSSPESMFPDNVITPTLTGGEVLPENEYANSNAVRISTSISGCKSYKTSPDSKLVMADNLVITQYGGTSIDTAPESKASDIGIDPKCGYSYTLNEEFPESAHSDNDSAIPKCGCNGIKTDERNKYGCDEIQTSSPGCGNIQTNENILGSNDNVISTITEYFPLENVIIEQGYQDETAKPKCASALNEKIESECSCKDINEKIEDPNKSKECFTSKTIDCTTAAECTKTECSIRETTTEIAQDITVTKCPTTEKLQDITTTNCPTAKTEDITTKKCPSTKPVQDITTTACPTTEPEVIATPECPTTEPATECPTTETEKITTTDCTTTKPVQDITTETEDITTSECPTTEPATECSTTETEEITTTDCTTTKPVQDITTETEDITTPECPTTEPATECPTTETEEITTTDCTTTKPVQNITTKERPTTEPEEITTTDCSTTESTTKCPTIETEDITTTECLTTEPLQKNTTTECPTTEPKEITTTECPTTKPVQEITTSTETTHKMTTTKYTNTKTTRKSSTTKNITTTTSVTPTCKKALDQIRLANVALTIKFLKQLTILKPEKTVVVSALYLLIVLGQLAYYAIGNTFKEMTNALRVYDKDQIKCVLLQLNEILEKLPPGLHLLGDNILSANAMKPFTNDFMDSMEHMARGKAVNLDYSNGPRAMKTINQLVQSATNNETIDVISSSRLINDRTEIISATGLYKETLFRIAFDPDLIKTKNFYISPSKPPVKMNYYYSNGKFNYYASNKLQCQFVRIQYENNLTSLIVAQPYQKYSYADVLNRIENNPEFYEEALTNMKQTQLVLALPEIYIRTLIDTKELLKKTNTVPRISNNSPLELKGAIVNDQNVTLTYGYQTLTIKSTYKGTKAPISSDQQPKTRAILNSPFPFFIESEDSSRFALIGGVFGNNNED